MDDLGRVLIIGGGAREHTIASMYEKSPHVDLVVVAPGNGLVGYKSENNIFYEDEGSIDDPGSILDLVNWFDINLVDVAQDNALAAGVVDYLQEKRIRVFGPTKKASQIEWDKGWSRYFMRRNDIPQPDFNFFDGPREAIKFVEKIYEEEPGKALYIKATGLCYGKGALETRSLEQAINNIELMASFKNDAGRNFLIERAVVGEEFSSYAIVDGENYVMLKSAQDNKRVFDYDAGGQTGGMGAVSPAMVTEPFEQTIQSELIERAIHGMRKENRRFKGILYLGGIIVDGKPMVIEYNSRWGDPECQVVLPAVKSDYFELVNSCINGELAGLKVEQDDKTRVCVVGSAKGYPNDYSESSGKVIFGIDDVLKIEGVSLYGAGIRNFQDRFFTNGGRLFSVVGEGGNILEAKNRAYSAIKKLSVEGDNLHYRNDIGRRDLLRYSNRE